MQKKLSLLNFKKLLFSATVTTLVILPASFSLVACGSNASSKESGSNKPSNQDIISAINKFNMYQFSIFSGDKVEEIKKNIPDKVVKYSLAEPIKSHFNESLFKVVKITNELGVELSDKDLISNKWIELDGGIIYGGSIQAKIFYTYQDSEEQTTNLKINIYHKEEKPEQEEKSEKEQTSEEKIINLIESNSYKINIKIGTSANEIKAIVDREIQVKLKADANNFEPEKFVLNNVTNQSGVELSDEDFLKIKVIKAKISYDYGDFKSQTANLNLAVEPIKVTEHFTNYFKIPENKENFNIAYEIGLTIQSVREKLEKKFKDYLFFSSNDGNYTKFEQEPDNYQFENIYVDEQCKKQLLEESELTAATTYYLKINGINQLKGWFALEFDIVA